MVLYWATVDLKKANSLPFPPSLLFTTGGSRPPTVEQHVPCWSKHAKRSLWQIVEKAWLRAEPEPAEALFHVPHQARSLVAYHNDRVLHAHSYAWMAKIRELPRGLSVFQGGWLMTQAGMQNNVCSYFEYSTRGSGSSPWCEIEIQIEFIVHRQHNKLFLHINTSHITIRIVLQNALHWLSKCCRFLWIFLRWCLHHLEANAALVIGLRLRHLHTMTNFMLKMLSNKHPSQMNRVHWCPQQDVACAKNDLHFNAMTKLHFNKPVWNSLCLNSMWRSNLRIEKFLWSWLE